ncbi:hypothetical protein FACS1894166_01830 [Bacilli bacterium]|nr:hypothetical protein FACS1894166_01830 [Bacilli bacterium]
MPDGKRIYILGKQIGFTKKGTQALTGGSSGSLVINDEKQAVAINYAGNIANNKKNSIENFALMLNCDSPYYNGSDDASNYRYNILSRFFPML